MKKLIFVFALVCGISTQSWAQWQTPGTAATGQSTDGNAASAVTGAINTTTAKMLVAFLSLDKSCTSASIADSKSNVWTSVGSEAGTTGSTVWVFFTSGSFTSGTSHTFTPSFSGCSGTSNPNTNGYPSIIVVPVGNSGGGSTGLHVDQVTVGNSSSSPVTAATITPTVNNELLFSAAGMAVASGTWTSVSSGFTISASLGQAANAYGLAVAYKIQTTATAIAPSWVYTGSGPTEAINVSFFNTPGATTISPATCSLANFITALNASSNGDTVSLPSGTCDWTPTGSSATQFAFPSNFTLKGATVCTGSGNPAVNNLACTDNTILQYNPSCGNGCGPPWMEITGAANGTTQITGITFHLLQTAADGDGLVLHPSPSTRVDHIDFSCDQYGAHPFDVIFGSYYALFDHDLFKLSFNSCTDPVLGYFALGNPAGETAIFLQAPSWGDANMVFIEDSTFMGNYIEPASSEIEDCKGGGRMTIRFNTWHYGGVQTHPAVSSNQDRGCRLIEQYMNKDTYVGNGSVGNTTESWISAGTQMVWGNDSGNSSATMFRFLSERRSGYTYNNGVPPPTSWGWCGTTQPTGLPAAQQRKGGVVSITWSGTSTGSGSQTNVSQTSSSGIGLYATFNVTESGGTYTVTVNNGSNNYSVGDTITIAGTSIGGSSPANDLTITVGSSGTTMITGSNYDQNVSGSTGYKCLDDVGTGTQVDSFSNTFPYTNLTNGCVGQSEPGASCSAWPHQDTEPIYEWGNKWTCAPGFCPGAFLSISSDVLTANVDYYNCQTSNHATGLCDTFNGTVGVGMGTRASRPSTCTTGVAYFSVDQGNWNAGNLGTGITISGTTYYNGVLDKCTATNTWTNNWYVPYTYPNPNQSIGSGGGTGSFSYYQAINFTSSTTQIPSSQTGFNYVVKQTMANTSHITNSNGYDIRPYADSTCSTTPLQYQLISYSNSTGNVLMWIQGTISAGGHAYLCYGNSSLTTDGSNTTTSGVFSNDKYRVHGGNGSTLDLTDVSGNGNMATNTSVTAASAVAINGAMAFNGSTSQLAFSGISLTAPFSIREWVSFSGAGGGANDGFQGIATSASSLGAFLHNTAGALWVQELYTAGGNVAESSTALSFTTPHFIELTWDGTTANFYLDGTLDNGSVTGTPSLSSLSVTTIGNDAGSEAFNGSLEEIGMNPIVNSANWVTSEYYNEKPSSTFLSLGPEINPGVQSGAGRVRIRP